MTSFNMRGDFLRALSPWQIPRSCPVRFSLSNDRPGNAQQAHGHQTGERGFSHAKLLLSLITSINSSTFFILLIKINSAAFWLHNECLLPQWHHEFGLPHLLTQIKLNRLLHQSR
jgi:hypothetical protein